MTVDPVVIEGATLLQPGQSQAAQQSTAPQSVSEATGTGRTPGDQVSLSGKPEATYRDIQDKHEQGNAAAGAIRRTDHALKDLGQKVDAMKAPLETIVKNFPPFSPEDKARMKLLQQFSGLRKEIAQLTYPPPPDVVPQRQAVELPAPLGMDATDSQIADHISKLDATVASLNDTRIGIAADTTTFVNSGGFTGRFSGASSADSGLTMVSLTPSDAAQKSAEVGQQFAKGIAQGVTGTASQFLRRMS